MPKLAFGALVSAPYTFIQILFFEFALKFSHSYTSFHIHIRDHSLHTNTQPSKHTHPAPMQARVSPTQLHILKISLASFPIMISGFCKFTHSSTLIPIHSAQALHFNISWQIQLHNVILNRLSQQSSTSVPIHASTLHTVTPRRNH